MLRKVARQANSAAAAADRPTLNAEGLVSFLDGKPLDVRSRRVLRLSLKERRQEVEERLRWFLLLEIVRQAQIREGLRCRREGLRGRADATSRAEMSRKMDAALERARAGLALAAIPLAKAKTVALFEELNHDRPPRLQRMLFGSPSDPQ